MSIPFLLRRLTISPIARRPISHSVPLPAFWNSSSSIKTIVQEEAPSSPSSAGLLDSLEAELGEETDEQKIEQNKQRAQQDEKERQTTSGVQSMGPKPLNWKKELRKEKRKEVPTAFTFSTATFKISPRKLQLLATLIKKMPVDEAILQLKFSEKKAANRIKSTLLRGKHHALALGMNESRLQVSRAWVGKGKYIKRMLVMGRGRFGIMYHKSARMYFMLEEGATYMEKQHKTHLKLLRRATLRGPHAHARVNSTKVHIGAVKQGHWRW